MIKLIPGNNKQEYIPAAEKLSLDDLYEQAEELGSLQTGSFRKNRAELRVKGLADDYVDLKEDRFDLKKNIATVIYRARLLKQFYEEQGW